MGFSAGGNLAAMLATDGGVCPGEEPTDPADEIDRESARPDGQILAYPVIFLSRQPLSHQGSRRNLLGSDAPEALARALDATDRVTASTPPAFVFHTAEDKVVPVANSVEYAAALHRHDVQVDLHIYNPGHHGVGLAEGMGDLEDWTHSLRRWLERMGW